jgi:acetylornithine deacetylase/succinyl-diaminopimelate desuccinylase-like protein
MTLDLLAVCRSLIAIDSRSSVTLRPVVDLLAPLCDQTGLQTTLYEESRDGVAQFDLAAVRRGTADVPPLLLNTHLDTVPPGDASRWTECGSRPLHLTQRDGLLYGLGAADVKLDFVCKLLALERLRDEPLERPVILAGTYGEETGRWGAHLLARRLRPLPAMAMVGEPTSLRPCTDHKGYLEIIVSATHPGRPRRSARCWRVDLQGVAAHSSQPHKGRSANDACLDALAGLTDQDGVEVLAVEGGDLVNRVATEAHIIVAAEEPPVVAGATVTAEEPAGTATSFPELAALLLTVHQSTARLRQGLQRHTQDGFDPPWSTVNNGLVELRDGTLRHVVDIRRLAGASSEEAIAAHLDRVAQAARASGCRAEVVPRLDSPPFRGDPGSRLTRALEHVLLEKGMPKEHEWKSGTTEASVYSALGVDTVVFGPGQAGGNIHRPNEHVPLADLHAAIEIYASVVRRLCSS